MRQIENVCVLPPLEPDPLMLPEPLPDPEDDPDENDDDPLDLLQDDPPNPSGSPSKCVIATRTGSAGGAARPRNSGPSRTNRYRPH
jgi:hypothetical protein